MGNDNFSSSSSSDPDVENFFSRFSEDLYGFATRHQLKIDKYWHGLPSWRLSFKHPKGGFGCIEVFREDQAELRIYGYWWLDNYDDGIRFGRRYESEILNADKVTLGALLEETLKEMLAWALNSWTEIAEGFGPTWSRTFDKEQFTALNDSYPVLKQ